MKEFQYERAATVGKAVDAANRPDTRYIAGGTNLLDLMKVQVETPTQLVDISRLPLNDIENTPEGGLRIGAMVRNSVLASDPRVLKQYPLLSRAILAGASAQIRNKASTGGNLLQRTRCYYFYDIAMPCNKRQPGSGCSAISGYNRIHAIVGGSDQCIAVHPSDMAVALRALNASIETMAVNGKKRVIPIADFHKLPGNTPNVETDLSRGELITEVVLPPAPKGVQLYRKVRDRASYAFALVSVAALVELSNGKIRNAQLAFGGLAHKPWRVPGAEQALLGRAPDAAASQAAAELVLAGAQGRGNNDFKIPLTRRLLHAVLSEAGGPGSVGQT